FVESDDITRFNFGDNLTVAPNGHLIVCEDQYTRNVDNHLRGVTPQGALYDFARLHVLPELAGACFSADGLTLFVNVFSPGKPPAQHHGILAPVRSLVIAAPYADVRKAA